MDVRQKLYIGDNRIVMADLCLYPAEDGDKFDRLRDLMGAYCRGWAGLNENDEPFNFLVSWAGWHSGKFLFVSPRAEGRDRAKLLDEVFLESSNMLDNRNVSDVRITKNTDNLSLKIDNGSLICCCGPNNYQKLIGFNPSGILIEQSLTLSPESVQHFRPCVVRNYGWIGRINSFKRYGRTLYCPHPVVFNASKKRPRIVEPEKI